MVDLEMIRIFAQSNANDGDVPNANMLLACIAELTALRAKVAAGEALREVVRGAIDEVDGGDSYGSNFTDIRRGGMAYDAATKVKP